MNTFAISDIHGRIRELENLFEFIDCSPSDKVIFLGDYIDRGLYSKSVIDKLIELKKIMPNAYILKGNHEDLALSARTDADVKEYWLRYGGDKTLESYNGIIPDTHWEFLQELEKFVETDNAIFIHANLEPHLEMKDQKDETLMWERINSPLEHFSGKKIYCGHTTQISGYPKIQGSAHCIDCAGWLTAINVNTDRVYQVNEQNSRRQFDMQGKKVYPQN